MLVIERIIVVCAIAVLAYLAVYEDQSDSWHWCPIGEYDLNGFCDWSDAVEEPPAEMTVRHAPPPERFPSAFNACSGICRQACGILP